MSHKKWQDDNGGYSRIANKLLESWVKLPLNGRELRILLAIVRRTYGYGKKQAPISANLLSKMTGISRANCTTVLTSLKKRGVLLNLKQVGAIENETGGCFKSDSSKTGKFASQVVGINKHIEKCVNFDTVLSNLKHIKDIINIFKEGAGKGPFAEALSRFEEEKKNRGVIMDQYCLLLMDCIKHIKVDAKYDQARIDQLSEKIDALYHEHINTGKDTFAEFKAAVYEFYNVATGKGM